MSGDGPFRTSAAIFSEVAYEIQHQAGNLHIEAAVRDRQSPRVTDLEQSGRGAIVALYEPPALTIVRLAATYRRNALRSAIGGRT